MVVGLVPAAALVEELAAEAVHPRRRDEISSLQALLVTVHEAEEAGLLSFAHGGQRCDDQLGVLELDQVMQLNAALLVARVVTVENGVAAGLCLVGVGYLLRVGGGGGGLVVDDLFLLNQIQDTDELGQPVFLEIGFHGYFNGIGFGVGRQVGFPQVSLAKPPAGLLLVLLVTVPIHGVLLLICPRFGELVMESFQRERFVEPARLVPGLQCGVNRIADMEGWCSGFAEAEHVTEIELQPALQKRPEPRG